MHSQFRQETSAHVARFSSKLPMCPVAAAAMEPWQRMFPLRNDPPGLRFHAHRVPRIRPQEYHCKSKLCCPGTYFETLIRSLIPGGSLSMNARWEGFPNLNSQSELRRYFVSHGCSALGSSAREK